MALYFLDSSAVVKRYHFELGTVWVRAACRRRMQPNGIFTSQLAEIEVVAALRQIARARNAHPSAVEALIAEFRRDVAQSRASVHTAPYRIVPITQAVVDAASELCDHFWRANPRPLRTLDAIQLATALSVQASSPDECTFVSGDTRLLQVADALNMPGINPDSAPIPA